MLLVCFVVALGSAATLLVTRVSLFSLALFPLVLIVLQEDSGAPGRRIWLRGTADSCLGEPARDGACRRLPGRRVRRDGAGAAASRSSPQASSARRSSRRAPRRRSGTRFSTTAVCSRIKRLRGARGCGGRSVQAGSIVVYVAAASRAACVRARTACVAWEWVAVHRARRGQRCPAPASASGCCSSWRIRRYAPCRSVLRSRSSCWRWHVALR